MVTNSAKVAAAKEWQHPHCTQEVKSFLGFVGYYPRFCWSFATVARPLNVRKLCFTGLRKRRVPSRNGSSADKGPVLTYPKPSISWTPGVVLSQVVEGEERVVTYYSKIFNPPQRSYCMVWYW